MAKRKTTAKTNNTTQKKAGKNNISDDKLKISFGLLILSFSALLTLAFVSHLFTWKADQSFEWLTPISESTLQVENWAGKIGAYFANLLMNKWLGISSFFVPFILFLIGFRLLKIKLVHFGKALPVSIILALLLSITFGYMFGTANGFLGSGPGGMHGYIISQWLNAFMGKTGTAFLLLIAYVSFLIFAFDDFFVWLKKVFSFNLPGIVKEYNSVFEDDAGHHLSSSPQRETQTVINDSDLIFETEYHTVEEQVSDEQENTDNGQGVKDGPYEQEEDDLELTVEKTEEEEFKGQQGVLEDYDPTLDLGDYKLPTLDLLDDHKSNAFSVSNEELINNKNKIVETLGNYKIQIDKIKATIGPTVTLYEIVPAPGVRISKIKSLEDDIALSLAALGIRIIAPIPGKGTIGIEVPNQNPEVVSMKSILSSKKFQETKHDICIALGKTISNETFTFDLTKMPHLLVAGATGQGKSVGLNAIITSILFKKHPSQLKFVLIDPKKVELTLYSRIERHYLAKLPDAEEAIVTDTQKVINSLNSLTIEMDSRYDLLKKAHVRNIKEYNAKFVSRKLNPEKGHRYMPYIVLVIDEFADLIMTAGREVETPLARLAQLARAIGIHLIIATQRPTTNIITGVIKANFPARIAFRVTSMIDSRTILDHPGANQLIGRGDMLMSSGSEATRLQCAFIDIPELERITEFIGSQRAYPTAYELPEYVDEGSVGIREVDLNKRDELFDDAARLVVSHQQGSTSLIQRKFSIGYNRAGRIVDQLEAAGIVGPFEGSKARAVLFPDEYSLEQYLNKLNEN